MPRPRLSTALAPRNGVRSNKFSIVIHDVKPGVKDRLEAVISAIFEPEWFLVAEEKYNHQEGSHIHVFLQYNRSSFQAKSSVLKKMESLNLGGRVQVDYGKGSFEQCEKYLQGHTKEKHIDENLSAHISHEEYKRQLQEYSDSVPLFDFVDGRIVPNTFIDIPTDLVSRGRKFTIPLNHQDNFWSNLFSQGIVHHGDVQEEVFPGSSIF